MASAKLLSLQRNVRPLKRRASVSESSEEDSASGVDSSDSQDGNGEELQAASDTSDDELRDEQDAESDGGRSVGSDARQVQEGQHRFESSGSERDGQSEDNDELGFREVAFGSLKRAQESLPESGRRKRKRGSSDGVEDDKLHAVKARLREIREQKEKHAPSKSNKANRRSVIPNVAATTVNDALDDDHTNSDSDSAPSEEGAPLSRTSKHAPAAQTSRHQVTRKRQVITVPKRVVRDPRFDALHRNSAHPNNNSDKAYAFLRDYQNSEMDELKAAIRATASTDEKEILRRKLVSMQNRIKAKEAVERQQNVLRTHRKEERQRIEQGKNPYYLKKSELKERALVEKFKGMRGKEREKAIEKRRLKESQREKKRMPQMRRVNA